MAGKPAPHYHMLSYLVRRILRFWFGVSRALEHDQNRGLQTRVLVRTTRLYLYFRRFSILVFIQNEQDGSKTWGGGISYG